MRDFLDSVLTFIDLATLTDEEWALEIAWGDEADYTLETYNGLKEILAFREEPYSASCKLKNVYKAKGVEINPAAAAVAPKSNIFLGSPL